MTKFQSNLLRKGRSSQIGRPYLVTFSTAGRVNYFSDYRLASIACRQLYLAHQWGHVQNWCYVVMPDHVHWLFSLGEGQLSRVVGTVKSGISHHAGEKLWQGGFHDHALRQQEALLPVARYVVANPLREGLVKRVRESPFWDATWL